MAHSTRLGRYSCCVIFCIYTSDTQCATDRPQKRHCNDAICLAHIRLIKFYFDFRLFPRCSICVVGELWCGDDFVSYSSVCRRARSASVTQATSPLLVVAGGCGTTGNERSFVINTRAVQSRCICQTLIQITIIRKQIRASASLADTEYVCHVLGE